MLYHRTPRSNQRCHTIVVEISKSPQEEPNLVDHLICYTLQATVYPVNKWIFRLVCPEVAHKCHIEYQLSFERTELPVLEAMAADKRFTYSQTPYKDYGASITIQLPTTSANQNEDVDLNNNQVNNGSSVNHCYHQAATRSLLLDSSVVVPTVDNSVMPIPPPNYHEIPGIVPSYQGRTSGPPPSYDEVVNPNAPPPSYQSLFGQVREARKTSNGIMDLFRQLFLILIGTLGCTLIIGFLLLIPITMILVGIVYVNECRAENIPSFLVIGGLVWIVKNILNCYNQFKKDSTTSNRPPPRRAPISSTSTRLSGNQGRGLTVGQQIPNESITAPSANSQTSVQISTSHEPSTTRTIVSSREHHHQAANRIRSPSIIGITSFKCESMLNYFLVVWFLAGCIVVYRIYEPDYDNPLSTSYCNRTVYLYAFWLMTSSFVIMAVVLSCLCCLMASSLMSCNHGR